jgi:hypothetical protein
MAYNPQNPNGQTGMANSAPVVIASDQTAVPVTGTVRTVSTNSGGYSVAAGSTGSTKVDIGTANTPGIVAGWYIYNPNNTVAYVQFFDLQASAVSLGTTSPTYSIGIPALSAANLMSPVGINHSTAISIAITTTRAGSTGPSTAVDYNIWFKQ